MYVMGDNSIFKKKNQVDLIVVAIFVRIDMLVEEKTYAEEIAIIYVLNVQDVITIAQTF